MFEPSARIIADSVNMNGDRLTTFVLTYHRFIHSEVMTHRQFSRGSSSSRAIPVEKMIAKVQSEMVAPLFWGVNQKGMVAQKEMHPEDIDDAILTWDLARESAIASARFLTSKKAHKQIVNRLLEPFSSITVIVTATEYQNFFSQRCHPNAQPEIKALADAMKTEYDTHEPIKLYPENPITWHLPFIKIEDLDLWLIDELSVDELIKISVGRCARVSYLNHDGDRNLADDIKLHDRLLSENPAHLSPFEHVAIALPNSDKRANFTGFESYRYQLENKK